MKNLCLFLAPSELQKGKCRSVCHLKKKIFLKNIFFSKKLKNGFESGLKLMRNAF